MSYNGSGTFQINTSGQPVVTGTVISSSAFNALTADLATGLSTAITKDGQTATTVRIPFAAGINSSLTTDTSSGSTGSIFTAGGVGITKGLFVGGTATFSATPVFSALTASSAVATDASKNLVSVTNTGTGNNVLATSPTLVTPVLGAASATSVTVDAGAVGTPSITTTGDTNTGIFFPAADTIAFTEGGAEAMRINSSGNVGIGTTSPAGKLDVRGASYFGSPNTFIIGDDGGSDGAFLNETASVPMRFLTAGSERMRIDSSGNLLINSTSGSPWVSSKLFVSAAYSTFTNSDAPILCWNTSTTGTRGLINFRTNAIATPTGLGGINTDGTNTIYATTSDYRLKEEIAPMTGALAKVSALKPVTYKWKSNGSDGEGFIAHELAEICPHAVTGAKDAVDLDGNPIHQGIDLSFLIATLTAAIQEQQALITSLTDRIVALEAK